MRTTLSIDEDVAKLLRAEMRRSGGSLKAAVNHFLRLGLTTKRTKQKPFKVKPWNLQPPPGQSFDKIEQLVEHLEGPHHR